MKLRLLDDSIRLRLSRSDVISADRDGLVEGRTQFPGGSVFTFVLEAAADGVAGAAFADGRMVVRLPEADISSWANDDTAVSLHGQAELPDGGSLTLLVEKDFQCLTNRPEEDQSDLFTNPDAGKC